MYIIDEAHMLTKEGANAFLKTLEEPPRVRGVRPGHDRARSAAADDPLALPALRVPAHRDPGHDRTDARDRGAEGIAVDDAALGAIAYRADGGLRDAFTMLEQVAAFAQGPIDATTVDAAFGMTSREFARNVTGAMLAGDAAAALRAIDVASDSGADMVGLIRAVMGEFRHLLVARVNPELLARDLAADDAARTRELAAHTPQVKLVRALRLLTEGLSAARTFGQPRIELEAIALRLVLAGEDPSLDALATRVALLEAGSAPVAASPMPQATPPAPAPAPPPARAPERPRPPAPAPRRAAQAAAPPGDPPIARAARAAAGRRGPGGRAVVAAKGPLDVAERPHADRGRETVAARRRCRARRSNGSTETP